MSSKQTGKDAAMLDGIVVTLPLNEICEGALAVRVEKRAHASRDHRAGGAASGVSGPKVVVHFDFEANKVVGVSVRGLNGATFDCVGGCYRVRRGCKLLDERSTRTKVSPFERR